MGMLSQYIRVILGDNGVLTDYSIEADNEADNIPFALVATEDYIYIGQYFPWNNFYLKVDTVNDAASELSLDYWRDEWVPVVDILDGTKVSGVTLAKSGIVRFTPDIDRDWLQMDRTDDQATSGLDTVNIYDMYWLRMKYSNTLNPATKINKITYLFTSEELVNSLVPRLSQFLTRWESGKTDWVQQELVASQHVISNLKKRKLIMEPGQILKLDDFSMATAWKTVELIFFGLGSKYDEERIIAEKNFTSFMDGLFTIDKDRNARISKHELSQTQAELVR